MAETSTRKRKEKKKKTNDLYLPIFLYFFARSLLSCSIVFLPLCCPVILRARRSITLLGHFLLFFFWKFPPRNAAFYALVWPFAVQKDSSFLFGFWFFFFVSLTVEMKDGGGCCLVLATHLLRECTHRLYFVFFFLRCARPDDGWTHEIEPFPVRGYRRGVSTPKHIRLSLSTSFYFFLLLSTRVVCDYRAGSTGICDSSYTKRLAF